MAASANRGYVRDDRVGWERRVTERWEEDAYSSGGTRHYWARNVVR